MVSCRLICVFALLINKASLQVTVVGDIGRSIVLPCNSSEPIIQDINVRWRHNNSRNVCDIIKGKASVEYQEPQYKDRTETFPEEYEKSNFALKLNNLTHSDAGLYLCFILHSDEHQPVQLLLKEAKEKPAAEEEGNHQAETKLMRILIPVVGVFVVLCILLGIAYKILNGRDKTSLGCQSCRVWHLLSSNASSDTSEPCNQEHTELQTKA